MKKYVSMIGVTVLTVAIATIAISGVQNNESTADSTKTKTTEDTTAKKKKTTMLQKLKMDPRLQEIVNTLSNFEIPKENRIEGKEREKLVDNHVNSESLVVYENGLVIDSSKNKVDSIIHFKDRKNVGDPYGTQTLAYFNTILQSKLNQKIKLGEYIIVSPDSNVTKEHAIEMAMKEYIKYDDPTTTSVGGWDSVVQDTDYIIKTLNDFLNEEEIKKHDQLVNWIEEAKSYFVESKKIGVEDWKKAHDKYKEGKKFISKLNNAISSANGY